MLPFTVARSFFDGVAGTLCTSGFANEVKHDVVVIRNSPGGGTSWTSDNHAMFGRVHPNAALGVKFALYDRLVRGMLATGLYG